MKCKKFKIALATISIVLLITTIYNCKFNRGYLVYNNNNEIITYYEDIDAIKSAYNEISKYMKEQNLKSEEDLIIKEGSINNRHKTIDEVKSDLKKYIHINAYIMKSDDVKIGYVSNPSVGNLAVAEIKNECVNQYEGGNLQNISVNNKITYDESKFSLDKLESKDFIKSNIEKLNKNMETKVLSFTATEESKTLDLNNISTENGTLQQNNSYENNEEKSAQTMNQNCIGTSPVFPNKELFPPTIGVISSYYGERWGTIHKGLDIAANQGTPIKAAFDGTVEFSGVMNGYGNVIILFHGENKKTLYAHCNILLKNVGEKVTKGEEIATVGSTGDSTGPHLHFEIRIADNAVDPLEYCDK